MAVIHLENEALAAERREIARLYDQGVISEAVLNRITQQRDLEELRLQKEESISPQSRRSK